MSGDEQYDLVVVGAGPAGAAAAYFAAKGGLRVLLVDRCQFPRHKVCSGGLSPRALALLDEMGIVLEIQPSRVPVRSLRIGSPNGVVIKDDIPITSSSHGHGYIVPRFELDDLVRTQALRQGVSALQAGMSGLLTSGAHVEGVVADDRDIRAKAIILAAGAHPPVPSAMRVSESDTETFFAIQAHCDGPPDFDREEIEIYFERSLLPGYFWIFPDGQGRVTVGAGLWGNPGGGAALLERFEAGARYANARGRAFIPNSDSLAFERWIIPVHRVVQASLAPNVLLAGDAGRFANPFTGEGIFYAMESGRLAGSAVADELKQDASGAAIAERYRALLSALAEDLRLSWLLRDFFSDADRAESLIVGAAQDPVVKTAIVGAIMNVSAKSEIMRALRLRGRGN